MEQSTYKCPDCDFCHQNLLSLSVHYRKRHKQTAERLRIVLFHGGTRPTCACGCGGVVRYLNINDGFSEYVCGHYSRVKNNWGHNAAAQQKSQDVRRAMHDRGEIKIWNRGETKETDERLAAYGSKGSKTILSHPDELKRRSDGIKRSWETGAIVPLTGPNHSQWKGGSSALQPIVRSRLHTVWTYPKLKASGFKCSACGVSGPGLEVHHDQERFAQILQKAIAVHGEVDPSRPDDDFERKDAIAAWVTDYHVQHDVSGIVLCERCHVEAHAA